MEFSSAKASPLWLSPFSSPNAGALLRKRVLEWSQETGLPTSLRIQVDGIVLNLHESPLLSKCGYFKKALLKSLDIELPENFPGGSETFEMVALFTYDPAFQLDPFNVSALRCAAYFLEMTENYAPRNLCERSDLYLNQVVLQNWDDTLIVLQKCQPLQPWAEELLIVSRCVESLAFMACMEILDPEERRDHAVVTLEALAGRAWNCEKVKEIAGQDLWIKDLIALPFEFFRRIISSMRRQGMKEKYVSPIIIFYANKWVLSKKTRRFWENTAEQDGANDVNIKVSAILQGTIELLPVHEKACRVIPVAFYFALLSRSLTLTLSSDSRKKLEDHVAHLLHLAKAEDLLLPESSIESLTSSAEFKTMVRIVSSYVTSKNETVHSGYTPSNNNSIVAELWDIYLSKVAVDPYLGPGRFVELIAIIPSAERESHDHLYRAMNIFLLAHPHLSSDEKAMVCSYINCQKLSQDISIQAVQNEQMPVHLIVQALFVQQLRTHQAFKECSDSFRFMHSGELSGRFSSSMYQLPKSQVIGESPYKPASEEIAIGGMSLGTLLQKELRMQRSELTKADYESTSFRIQVLEQELSSLKESLQWENTEKGSEQKASRTQGIRLFGSKRKIEHKKRNPPGQVGSCIGSMGWTSQKKYANSLLKVFRRIAMLGKGK